MSETRKLPGLSLLTNRMIAIGGLFVLSPVLLVCSALVRFSSRGPILFRQTRIGLEGKSFTMLKFRTMTNNNSGTKITASNDPRVTKIGKFLRKTKLDELPELFNVAKGEMVFVGPRPEVPEMVDMSDPLWLTALSVRPGITDPITLHLRNEEALLATVEDKESYYVEVLQPFKLKGYAKYISIRTRRSDIKVIIDTVLSILRPQRNVEELLADKKYGFLMPFQ